MVTDQQVRKLMNLIQSEETLTIATARGLFPKKWTNSICPRVGPGFSLAGQTPIMPSSNRSTALKKSAHKGVVR
jgi:hypothetical protein